MMSQVVRLVVERGVRLLAFCAICHFCMEDVNMDEKSHRLTLKEVPGS